eukprot:TRINITY_DN3742_c0_g1_i2.p1 TRINITY_DN3742_c0_g1~~TRINITY_DN3742_c0_g1_i2.p1  ORF type:complete len:386 (+),score=88.05 TRINITY_DN3742_c0_g1_i2:222-1379(+)
MDEETNMLKVLNVTFDPSMMEIFSTLTGQTLVLSLENTFDATVASKLIQKYYINRFCSMPHLLDSVLDLADGYPIDFQAASGGSSLSKAILDKYFAIVNNPIHNSYGPTETTIYCTHHKLHNSEEGGIIGSPGYNTKVFILNEQQNPVPKGIKGYLYASGCLARGYYGKPSLTAKSFCPNPYENGSRMYNTGDIALLNYNRELFFYGREDDQIKIRGYRVEAGEVKASIDELPYIVNSDVFTRKTEKGAELLAYVICSNENIQTSTIVEDLSRSIPSYMIPKHITIMRKFPLDPNTAKVDRKSLPEPSLSSKKAEFAKPRDDMERTICGTWEEILRIPAVSIEDDYYEIGGDSISSIQMVARLAIESKTTPYLSKIGGVDYLEKC